MSEPSDNTIKIIKIHRIQDEDLIVLLDDWMSKTGIIGIIVNTVRRPRVGQIQKNMGKEC